jgi:hypothetical protein
MLGLGETVPHQSGAWVTDFSHERSLHLPEIKALPIIGALIALTKGYFPCALA